MKRDEDKVREELVSRLKQSLLDLGLDPEIREAPGETLVAAQKDLDTKSFTVVAQITSRKPLPESFDAGFSESARKSLAQATCRPSLANYSFSLGQSLVDIPEETREAIQKALRNVQRRSD